MKFPLVLPSIALLIGLSACKENDKAEVVEEPENTEFFETAPIKVPELSRNGLATEPTSFLRKQATSKINWQPWSTDILKQAHDSQKMIFVFVGSTVHPLSQSLLTQLESKFGQEINEDYLPALADSESDPSLTLACYLLSNERRDPISFPYLLWLSHEGNPVAWIPINARSGDDFLLGFRNAQNTVQAIREKSNRYVIENSRYDNDGRLDRIDKALTLTEEAEEQASQATLSELFLAAQSLCDLYDDLNQAFDNTGGIPPGHLITTLARIAHHPACPPRLRETATEATRDSIKLLVQSAIRDPLDNYFFVRRSSRTFAIPALSKKLETQAEMLSAMTSSPQTPVTERAVRDLLDALANRPLSNYAVRPGETEDLGYVWSIDELSKILNEDELAIAKSAFQLRALGNVPNPDDPSRKFFRRNTLGLKKFGEELAKATDRSPEEAEALLASAKDKILARRNEILQASDGTLVEGTSVLTTKARLLTALSRAQSSNPSPATLAAVESLGNEILTRFQQEDGHLLRIPSQEGNRAVPGFGSDYALTIDALLEWYRVSWNPDLLQTASQLTTILLEEFTNEKHRLLERAVDEQVLTFPSHGESMIFGPSLWGTAYGVLTRMASLGFEHTKLAPVLEEITPYLTSSLKFLPVVHTDYLYAAINNFDGYVLVLSKDAASNEKATLMNPLATAEFDCVAVTIEGDSLRELAHLGGSAGVLLKDGEKVASFAAASEIIDGVRREISK
ncbi:DUF255 domain-containing protein [Roseibacillus persicicus]|uniref:DUF255 domain-containing protein n=1 Tax=Roseibacillus persicicus TaxID=454148 RepID=UPI00280F27BF|nr:DUF255 domain-containing protein [Roseibacillus persicicus]MDQ8191906.1 DUF255 domain-containing protein [Roseibacillus persicicus]